MQPKKIFSKSLYLNTMCHVRQFSYKNVKLLNIFEQRKRQKLPLHIESVHRDVKLCASFQTCDSAIKTSSVSLIELRVMCAKAGQMRCHLVYNTHESRTPSIKLFMQDTVERLAGPMSCTIQPFVCLSTEEGEHTYRGIGREQRWGSGNSMD